MHDPRQILFLDIFVTVLVVYDLARVLKTGQARSWLAVTVTRQHQPARYWRYVYSSYFVLAFLAATFLWATVWPDSLK